MDILQRLVGLVSQIDTMPKALALLVVCALVGFVFYLIYKFAVFVVDKL